MKIIKEERLCLLKYVFECVRGLEEKKRFDVLLASLPRRILADSLVEENEV